MCEFRSDRAMSIVVPIVQLFVRFQSFDCQWLIVRRFNSSKGSFPRVRCPMVSMVEWSPKRKTLLVMKFNKIC